nr:IS3 family transposase [Gardnerella vaginalis]
MIKTLQIKRSSYYYAKNALQKPDKYAHIRGCIHKIAEENFFTYDSPRIWLALRTKGIKVSEKVVRRLMKEELIEVRYARRKRRYSSYIGEITPACSNIVNNNFHADSPNKIWLTDITEFSVKESKLYLSPMIDCFDSKVVSYALSNHPDQCLVDEMLEGALTTLKITECKSLAIHTDRGGHYRGGRWIERLEGLGITRSMSRKGNSGDNAACEGFFGRMKTEMYYPS